MRFTIRSLCAASALAGAFAIAVPNTAVAQGNGQNKTAKAEQKAAKAEQKAAKAEQMATRRVVNKTATHTRRRATTGYARILCEDGVVVRRTTDACAGHGGVASRQGSYGKYPPASDRARQRANSNSAVVRGIGANNTRTGAIARCSDGTYWHSSTRTGACNRHGGVARWL
ncbi:MAG: DUF3761 domain-containing protein [Gemmatimonadaceae bacterium]